MSPANMDVFVTCMIGAAGVASGLMVVRASYIFCKVVFGIIFSRGSK